MSGGSQAEPSTQSIDKLHQVARCGVAAVTCSLCDFCSLGDAWLAGGAQCDGLQGCPGIGAVHPCRYAEQRRARVLERQAELLRERHSVADASEEGRVSVMAQFLVGSVRHEVRLIQSAANAVADLRKSSIWLWNCFAAGARGDVAHCWL